MVNSSVSMSYVATLSPVSSYGRKPLSESHKKNESNVSITTRQKWVANLLSGNDVNISDLFENYGYIAERTAQYTFWHQSHSIPFDDFMQQAQVELLQLFHKLCGDVKHPGLVEIKPCGCCLGIRPWLIVRLRGLLYNWMKQNTIIRVPKNKFERKVKGFIPPEVNSLQVFIEEEGCHLDNEDSLAHDNNPENVAIERELWSQLKLSEHEKKLLTMRAHGHTLEEIGEALGKHKTTIQYQLTTIQMRYKRIHG